MLLAKNRNIPKVRANDLHFLPQLPQLCLCLSLLLAQFGKLRDGGLPGWIAGQIRHLDAEGMRDRQQGR